ncbi:MAG: GTP-binding protein [Clostridia bacterium]|nr:GTP-binding protein [Clostridia bacterium]
MTKVDIFSGFLGAGKTTLIKKLIKEAYHDEMLVIIENEFGQIGIDGGFLKEAGIQITEMNSGCICCSLVGDFGKALAQVKEQYNPDRIIIEPSGVGKLSDVIRAVQGAGIEDMELNAFTTVIDASKCKMYLKNFAEFYQNQIEFASSVVLSRTDGLRQDKLDDVVAIVRSLNEHATLITTPWDQLDGSAILAAMEKRSTLEAELEHLLEEQKEKEKHHHHHHHHDGEECDDPECECHHHHHDDEDEEHEHHHHHHHHDDEEEHEHHHHHHHDHHADEVFTSWGTETAEKFTQGFVEDCLDELMTGRYGMVLRAKGIVATADGQWIHFDYVPGEKEIRFGAADVIGKLCVIGTGLNKKGLKALFTVANGAAQ